MSLHSAKPIPKRRVVRRRVSPAIRPISEYCSSANSVEGPDHHEQDGDLNPEKPQKSLSQPVGDAIDLFINGIDPVSDSLQAPGDPLLEAVRHGGHVSLSFSH